MEPTVICEENSSLAINKPSGWITNEASTTKEQPVIQTWLSRNFDYEIAKDKEFRSGIVHRLDKETSGVLLVAKTKDAFNGLQSQFKERVIKKHYLALAHGIPSPREGIIDAPVGRLPWRRDRFGVLPGGRSAVTKYKVSAIYSKSEEKFSLIDLFPETGRTHQIRIHLKHLGHAIVADEFYAGRKTARNDRKWCPRLFLHASNISFLDPESKAEVFLEASLAPDLKKAVSTLDEMSENI